MRMTLEIPDHLAQRLTQASEDLSRQILENLAAESYRAEVLSHAEVGELLGLSRLEVDAFLKSKEAYPDDEFEDLKADEETLHRLGII